MANLGSSNRPKNPYIASAKEHQNRLISILENSQKIKYLRNHRKTTLAVSKKIEFRYQRLNC